MEKKQIAWLGNRKVFRMPAGHQTAFRFCYIPIAGNRIQLHDCPKIFTYSMEQSPSWEANRFAASQEIPRILWNQKVHYYMVWIFRNKICFYGELSATRPTPKLEDHPLAEVRGFLFNIFAATFHIGDRSSIRNLRTRHVVVTGTHLSNIQTSTSLNSSLPIFVAKDLNFAPSPIGKATKLRTGQPENRG